MRRRVRRLVKPENRVAGRVVKLFLSIRRVTRLDNPEKSFAFKVVMD